MKAAVIHAFGEAPSFADFADPSPEPGEVVVTVAAAALSHLVRGRASGAHYSASGKPPFIPGVDGVGRREDGRRVFFLMPRAPYGAFAQRTVVAAERCLPLPDDLDDVTAAALANPGMSSWAAFAERAKLQPGETVLVNGATGAAGRLAVAIARHLGAGRVIATGRNAEALAALGADAIIPLTGDGEAMEKRFQAEFAKGVDVVIDYLWGESAERLLIAAAKAGADAVPIRFVQVGAVSGANISLPSAVLRSSAITLMGSGLGSVRGDRFLACIRDLLAAAPAGGFKVATRPIPLSDVAAGWADTSGARVVFTM